MNSLIQFPVCTERRGHHNYMLPHTCCHTHAAMTVMTLTVVPGRTEGVLLDTPTWWEDDKISDSNTRLCTGAGKHREDGGILGEEADQPLHGFCSVTRCGWQQEANTHCMVKGHSIDDHELGEVILVGIVVAMPRYHIKGGVALKIERQVKLHT